MTTNKPEVVAYLVSMKNEPELGHWFCEGAEHPEWVMSEPLIRLADYEALQADRAQQYDMKVKAREQRDAVTAKLNALQAECEKLRMDAERYRWLREAHTAHPVSLTICKVGYFGLTPWSGDDPDAAIDAAMQEASV